jgi:hypothetical protein
MGFLGRTAAKVKDRFERSEWTAVEENPGQKLESHDGPTKVDEAGFLSLCDTDDTLFTFDDTVVRYITQRSRRTEALRVHLHSISHFAA